MADVPEGWTFLRQLPEKVWKTEVWELIVSCFTQLSEAHAHMLSFMANISSLAKITDPETFDMVMKAAARQMIQVNVPEHYLSPVQDPPPKTTAEEHLSQLEKSHPPPAHISCTGTMVQTHQASSCSGLAPSQTQVFQWRHHQGGLHYV